MAFHYYASFHDRLRESVALSAVLLLRQPFLARQFPTSAARRDQMPHSLRSFLLDRFFPRRRFKELNFPLEEGTELHEEIHLL